MLVDVIKHLPHKVLLQIDEKSHITFCKKSVNQVKKNMFSVKRKFCAFINTSITHTDSVNTYMYSSLPCEK